MSGLSSTQRRTILDYLDQSRRAREVIDRIGHTVPHTLGVLTALVSSRKAIRLRHGVYLRADRVATVGVPSGHFLVDAIMAYCSVKRSIDEIGRLFSRSPQRLRTLLNDMAHRGQLERVGRDGYRPPQPDFLSALDIKPRSTV